MKRRALLKAAGVGTAATALGLWATRRSWLGVASRLSRFQGLVPLRYAIEREQNRLRLADDLDAFDEALKQARHSKKPVLVFVIPESGDEQYKRADLLSNLLNVGRNEDLALLTLAEVCCARMEWVRARFPKAPAGEPWVLVIDEHVNPVEFHAADFGAAVNAEKELAQFREELVRIQARPRPELQGESEAAQAKRLAYLAKEHQLIDDVFTQQTNRVGDIIRQVLVSDHEAVKRRGRQVADSLSRKLESRVDNVLLFGTKLTDAEFDIAAPCLYSTRSWRSSERELLDDLAHLAVSKYRLQNVPGSRWAVESCGGVYPESEPVVAMACGAAATPLRSRRFLDFYNKLPDE